MKSEQSVAWFWAALWIAVQLLAACRFSEAPDVRTCSENEKAAQTDCPANYTCYRGYCIRKQPSDAGSNGMTDTDPSMDPKDTGPTGPLDTGPTPPGDAAIDAMPRDASPDPQPECASDYMRTCRLPATATPTADSCRQGQQRCLNGRFGPCIAEVNTTDEHCNALDDDCDGRVDEQTEEVCYPEGQSGCMPTSGAWVCMGMCIPGRRTCRDGVLQACSGATTPVPEECTVDGTAADESCNGGIDEGCVCTGSASRACYTGPIGTVGIGRCASGTQRCESGTLTECTGSVVPRAESCANEGDDDDCNGPEDDILDRGTACIVSANQGPCRLGTLECRDNGAALTCVTPAPSPELCNGIDDDCNGGVDETFDVQTDPQHCGDCATRCGLAEVCCAGKCVDTNNDAANCGGCGPTHACAGGSSCCSGTCADLARDPSHCGTCARACDLGATCCSGSCADTASDANHCGVCGTQCPGTLPACCSSLCVDLVSEANCGSCGADCQQRGGTDCRCLSESGRPACGPECN